MPPPPVPQRYGSLGQVGNVHYAAQHVQGPSILLPGYSRPSNHLYRPPIAQPVPLDPQSGYTNSHLVHHTLQERLRTTAYAGQGGQVIVVNVQMVYIKLGQVTKKTIGVCSIH